MHVGPQAVSGAAVLQFLLTSFAGGVRPVVREIVSPQALVLAACRLRRGSGRSNRRSRGGLMLEISRGRRTPGILVKSQRSRV